MDGKTRSSTIHIGDARSGGGLPGSCAVIVEIGVGVGSGSGSGSESGSDSGSDSDSGSGGGSFVLLGGAAHPVIAK